MQNGAQHRQQCSVLAHQTGQHSRRRIVAHARGATRARVRAPWPPVPRRSSGPRSTTATSRPGAKLVPFAGWEMPVQYAGIKEEHLAVRDARRRSSTSRTWARSRRPGRTRRRSCSASSPTTSPRSPRTARSTACSARRTAASWTTSSPTGSVDDRFLTVTNAANHEKDLAWFQQAGRARSTSTLHDRLHDYAMLAVQGPEARGIVAGLTDGELPKRFRTAHADRRRARPTCSSAAPATPARTASSCSSRREHATDGLGRAGRGRRHARGPRRARHAAPGGLLPPLRQRPDGDARPDRGRPRLVRARRTRASSAPRRSRSPAPTARPRSSSRS